MYLAGEAEQKRCPAVAYSREGGIRNAESRACRGTEPVFCRKHEGCKPRICSYKFNDATMSKSSGLRRQRIVPKQNVGRDTLRQGGRALAANARERKKVHQSSEGRQIVWLRLGGHRGAQRAVGEVRGNAAVVFNKPIPSEAVPQHIKDYLACSKCKPIHDQRRLVGALLAQLILLYALMLKWYLDHGLKITAATKPLIICCKKVSRGS